mgnify:CR=1 FL=1
MRELIIAGRRIDDQSDAFVVAEIGSNHMGRVETAKALVDAAAAAGADAVKFQKRDLLAWSERNPDLWDQPYHSEHAFGPTYGEHRAALELSTDDFRLLQRHAQEHEILFFSTAWDVPSLEVLLELGVPAVKLASASIVDYPLLDAAARAMTTGTALFVSTGGATETEINLAIAHLSRVRGWTRRSALLQCTSIYPCPAEDLNLGVLRTFRARYPCTIGLSDHYDGVGLGAAAYLLGARIFERHFTLSRSSKGSDQAFSLEPEGLRRVVRDLRHTRLALGDGVKRRLPGEIPPLLKMGRSGLT